jgi:aryl-phospho-beta-D-glucosidase BglC (GH1 family)
VATKLVKLARSGRLVYSPHDYPPSLYEQPWFQVSNYPANLPAVWESNWGFIETKGIAPLLLGEFGSGLSTTRDNQCASQLASYIVAKKLDWGYFAFNANITPDMGLLNQDWTSLNARRQSFLRDLIARTKP